MNKLLLISTIVSNYIFYRLLKKVILKTLVFYDFKIFEFVKHNIKNFSQYEFNVNKPNNFCFILSPIINIKISGFGGLLLI